MQNGFEISEKM